MESIARFKSHLIVGLTVIGAMSRIFKTGYFAQPRIERTEAQISELFRLVLLCYELPVSREMGRSLGESGAAVKAFTIEETEAI
jgi:hypothetical protein